MNNDGHAEPKTTSSESDVGGLYDELFGTPALDALKDAADEPESSDDADAFVRIYEEARERPWVALRAVYTGVASHFRGEGPFGYSVGENRTSGEVNQ